MTKLIDLLEDNAELTLDKLIELAYDSYLPAFRTLIPPLIKSFNSANDSIKSIFEQPILMLRNWNYRFSASSAETTVAIYWAMNLRHLVSRKRPESARQAGSIDFLATKTYDAEKLEALSIAMKVRRAAGSPADSAEYRHGSNRASASLCCVAQDHAARCDGPCDSRRRARSSRSPRCLTAVKCRHRCRSLHG